MMVKWIDDKYPAFVFLLSQKIMGRKKRIIFGPLIILNKDDYDDNRLKDKKLAYCLAQARVFYNTRGLYCLKGFLDREYAAKEEIKSFAVDINSSYDQDKISQIYSVVDYLCDNSYIDESKRGWAIVQLGTMVDEIPNKNVDEIPNKNKGT